MSKLAIVVFSGYGHTLKIAEAAAADTDAVLVEIDANGDLDEDQLQHQPIWVMSPGNLKNLPMLHHPYGHKEAGKIKYLVVFRIAPA